MYFLPSHHILKDFFPLSVRVLICSAGNALEVLCVGLESEHVPFRDTLCKFPALTKANLAQ